MLVVVVRGPDLPPQQVVPCQEVYVARAGLVDGEGYRVNCGRRFEVEVPAVSLEF